MSTSYIFVIVIGIEYAVFGVYMAYQGQNSLWVGLSYVCYALANICLAQLVK